MSSVATQMFLPPEAGHAQPTATHYPMAMAPSSAALSPCGLSLAAGPPQVQQLHVPTTRAQVLGPHQTVLPADRAAAEPEAKPLVVMAAEQALADPVMREAIRQQAVQIGGHAVVAAKHYGHQGLMAFQDYVQQGPKGISVLCFVGGAATSVLGFMSICNFFGTLTDPFHYILNAYMFAFGLATAVIEADTDRIGMLMSPFDRLAEPVMRAQAWLHEECRLLTTLRGRGLFYLYQGTLMVTQCILCLLFLAGLYNMLMGVLCVLTSFGFKPDIEGAFAAGNPWPSQQYSYAAVPEAQGSVPGPAAAGFADQGFAAAEATFKLRKEQLSGKACRELWALRKQATMGDCHEPKPDGMFNGNAKEQWRLWNSLKGVPPGEAKLMFIERLQKEEGHLKA
mmetsp:Transcript_76762/g.178058  ORF Transcript_76762/g.178058 Transcript_76762/m.178058 type:complete len:395 (-) Transcript_76762:279-1463(-)